MPISSESLKQYLSSSFIETGTFLGDGTQAALDAGFPKIYTVEIYPDLYRAACDRFRGNERVELFEGSSIDRLQEILPMLNDQSTFYLDAHTCGGATGGAWNTPLVGELRLIATHPLKNHIILIDDVHLFGLDLPGMPEVMMRLAHINPAYTFALIPSGDPTLGPDILAALP